MNPWILPIVFLTGFFTFAFLSFWTVDLNIATDCAFASMAFLALLFAAFR